MVSDFSCIMLSLSVCGFFLFFCYCVQISPIKCFGDKRKFLEVKTYSNFGREYVS